MGLHTSWAKTKVQNTASGPPPTMCTIFGHQVQAVTKFTYLSSDIDSSGYCAPDIHRRLGLASSIMSQLDRVWKQSHLSNSTKFRIYTTVPVSCRYLCMDLKHGQCSSQMSQSFKHYICKIKGAFLASTGSTSSKNEEVSRISGLPPIDVVISQRRHSLFGHVREWMIHVRLLTKSYTLLSAHSVARGQTTTGEDHEDVRAIPGPSMQQHHHT